MSRQSRQIASIRAMSASTPGVAFLPANDARMFIHIMRRSSPKPECISALNAAGMRARRRVARPQRVLRKALGERFGDGERVPDGKTRVVDQTRDLARTVRRLREHRSIGAGLVQMDQHFVECECRNAGTAATAASTTTNSSCHQ